MTEGLLIFLFCNRTRCCIHAHSGLTEGTAELLAGQSLTAMAEWMYQQQDADLMQLAALRKPDDS